MCPGGQEGQRHPGLYQEQSGQQEKGGDRAPVLGTGEAAPRVPYAVLGTSLLERHGVAGACPKKGNEAGGGSRAEVL